MNLNKKTLVLIIIFISTNSYSGINDKQKTVIESQLFLLNEGMISKDLTKLSVQESIKLIKFNLNNLGISHDNFASETDVVLNNEVDQVVEKLKKDQFVYLGKIKAPEGEDSKSWVEREQLLFKSTDFGDDKDRALQRSN